MVVPGNTGIGQTPLATPFQPGLTESGPAEREPRQNETQPALAPSAESQTSEQTTHRAHEHQTSASVGGEGDEDAAVNADRGSLVDIQV